jgi:catechol 2,3-dioxygenase-like lactoylglutathione lyase family enzyme
VTALKLIPELYCADIEVTKKFYLDVFGFEIEYERTKEQFIYFTLDGVDIMVEGISGSDRR